MRLLKLGLICSKVNLCHILKFLNIVLQSTYTITPQPRNFKFLYLYLFIPPLFRVDYPMVLHFYIRVTESYLQNKYRFGDDFLLNADSKLETENLQLDKARYYLFESSYTPSS